MSKKKSSILKIILRIVCFGIVLYRCFNVIFPQMKEMS